MKSDRFKELDSYFQKFVSENNFRYTYEAGMFKLKCKGTTIKVKPEEGILDIRGAHADLAMSSADKFYFEHALWRPGIVIVQLGSDDIPYLISVFDALTLLFSLFGSVDFSQYFKNKRAVAYKAYGESGNIQVTVHEKDVTLAVITKDRISGVYEVLNPKVANLCADSLMFPEALDCIFKDMSKQARLYL